MADAMEGLRATEPAAVDASRGGPPAPAAPADDAAPQPFFDEQLSRRAALKFFGTAAAASAVGITGLAGTAEALTHLTPHAPPAPQQVAQTGRLFFTAHELATVRVLGDYVIPRDERSGSASEAKAPEFIDFMLADKETSEGSRVGMRGGLAWLDEQARQRFGKTFIAAADAQRRQILDDIAWPKKARPEMSQGVAFFNRFRDAVASAFFSSAIGWQDLRYVGNVFNPNWDGCPKPALDKLGVSYDVMKSRTE